MVEVIHIHVVQMISKLQLFQFDKCQSSSIESILKTRKPFPDPVELSFSNYPSLAGIRYNRQRAASAAGVAGLPAAATGRLPNARRHRKSQQEADGADEEQQRPLAAARGAGEAGPEAGHAPRPGMLFSVVLSFTTMNDV